MSEVRAVNHTTKQQQMLEHIQRAQQLGQSLSDYAREHGLSPKALYNYHWLLRQKGLLQAASDSAPFVKVTPTLLQSRLSSATAMTCHIYFPNGIRIQVDVDDNLLSTLFQQVQSL